MTRDELNTLADLIVRHPLFRKLVKEMTLLSALEREIREEQGAVGSFLECCYQRGIEWKIMSGHLVCTNHEKIGNLRPIFDRYRGAIRREIARLQRYDEEAERRRDQVDERHHSNGQEGF